MQIEVNKSYKTRSGVKVGPMVSSGRRYDPQYPFTVNHYFDAGWGGKAWRSDGTFDIERGKDNPCDLIAEWKDEPTGPVTIETVKRINPGVFDCLEVSNVFASDVTVRLINGRKAIGMTAPELTVAIAHLTAIRDALEGE